MPRRLPAIASDADRIGAAVFMAGELERILRGSAAPFIAYSDSAGAVTTYNAELDPKVARTNIAALAAVIYPPALMGGTMAPAAPTFLELDRLAPRAWRP